MAATIARTDADVDVAIYDRKLNREATPNIRDYSVIKILEQMQDQKSIVVAETLLVERTRKPDCRYALRIVELRSKPAMLAIYHEIKILNKLGQHPSIMSLFLPFRHRQYMGLLQPGFTTLRDKIDLIHRLKKTGNRRQVFFRNPQMSRGMSEVFNDARVQTCLDRVGVFDRNTVVYILREVIAGLDFLNSKEFVHTQISSSSVFVNEQCAVKIGSFLHCRRIGSKRWQFTGNPSILPPEAFLEQTDVDQMALVRIKPDFDTWSMGLFVLEMITAKRMRYAREEMTELGLKFLDGTEAPPSLAETDPSTIVDQQQTYDPDITDFLVQCFTVDHVRRKNPIRFLNHPFVTRPIDKKEGISNIGVEHRDEIPWNAKRSLLRDMLTVHSSNGHLKEEMMKAICSAMKLSHDAKCCPIFEMNLIAALNRGKYVAIDASLAFLQEEEEQNWSRDVLDVSTATTPGKVQTPTREKIEKPGTSGEQIRPQTWFPPKEDFQRVELVFFIAKDWTIEIRRLFIALQFVRWLDRGLISFADLLRVVDELDDLLMDFMVASEPSASSPYKNRMRTAAPDSVAFVTGLRRSLMDPESNDDPQTHRYNNIFIEVALKSEQVRQKKAKMDDLRKDDPIAYPNDGGPLYASATFYDLNLQRLRLLEAVQLGKKRIDEWEFDLDQRAEDIGSEDTPELTTLLKARRANPNASISSENDQQASNQARQTKLWGDYTRDFMFRYAKYAVPHQLDNQTARMLYGTPKTARSFGQISSSSSDDLVGLDFGDIQMQLAKTRSQQEGDTAALFKRHDDVQARESEMERLLREKEARIQSLEERMRQMQSQVGGTIYNTARSRSESPAPPRTEEIDEELSRLPKHNRRD